MSAVGSSCNFNGQVTILGVFGANDNCGTMVFLFVRRLARPPSDAGQFELVVHISSRPEKGV